MKKNSLLLLFTFIFSFIQAQQRKTIYISTALPIQFKTYIDGELQLFSSSSSIKIANVPAGEKKLHVRVLTPSNQQASIAIGKSSEKEEFYKIEQNGESYTLKPNPNGAKEDKTFFSRASYMPVRKPAVKVKDSGAVVQTTCHLSDSLLNKFILDMGNLPSPKAKKDFTLTFMKRKCLYTHQIKSIGYRIDDDEVKFEVYKNLFFPALDRNKFADLFSSFQSQKYAIQFLDWFNAQKI